MAAGPRQVVAAPQAGAPRVGLIISARQPDPGDGSWENGITYEPECNPQTGDPLDICEPGDGDDPAPNSIVEWDAYIIQAGYRCSTFGFRGHDWQPLARRRLVSDEDRQISAELWSGALARANGYPNRFLASAEADVVTDGATSLVDALACLENAIAGCNGGQQAMIHATSQVVTHWLSFGNLIRREGNLLLTNARDSIVVPATGYDGSGPQSPEPAEGQGTPEAPTEGSAWAYATGIIEVRRGPIELLGSPDNPVEWNHTTNKALVVAQRAALASWDACCHFAAELDVSLCSIGGVS